MSNTRKIKKIEFDPFLPKTHKSRDLAIIIEYLVNQVKSNKRFDKSVEHNAGSVNPSREIIFTIPYDLVKTRDVKDAIKFKLSKNIHVIIKMINQKIVFEYFAKFKFPIITQAEIKFMSHYLTNYGSNDKPDLKAGAHTTKFCCCMGEHTTHIYNINFSHDLRLFVSHNTNPTPKYALITGKPIELSENEQYISHALSVSGMIDFETKNILWHPKPAILRESIKFDPTQPGPAFAVLISTLDDLNQKLNLQYFVASGTCIQGTDTSYYCAYYSLNLTNSLLRRPTQRARMFDTGVRYEIVDTTIGTGGFSSVLNTRGVFYARLYNNTIVFKPKTRAIKQEENSILKKTSLNVERTKREYDFNLRTLSHPKFPIVVSQDTQYAASFLPMHYYPGQNFDEWCRVSLNQLNTFQAELNRLFVFLSFIREVRRFADAGIVHRDIKPKNAIVDPSLQVRLIDLGLNKNSNDDDVGRSQGTPMFTAPEAIEKGTDVRSDIYSLGVTIRYMYTDKILNKLDPVHSQAIRRLLDSMQHEQPELRPTLDQMESQCLNLLLSKACFGVIEHEELIAAHSAAVNIRKKLTEIENKYPCIIFIESIIVGKEQLWNAFKQQPFFHTNRVSEKFIIDYFLFVLGIKKLIENRAALNSQNDILMFIGMNINHCQQGHFDLSMELAEFRDLNLKQGAEDALSRSREYALTISNICELTGKFRKESLRLAEISCYLEPPKQVGPSFI